ncbi:hypothetical protein IEN85_18710 [Pelagicoccus sp. NFK12]|uniref:Uncharacterized protein n=1 Tax=Pelagicoccus enzymogenes TaxID=2773457 RepID=A0A927FBX4_9BACT|nr:hypothetical protein [Pelagicoccus enzymogenes]MBD5781540.1 hypothetical protein [Pelagicoccus enzymogenes]
MSYNSGGCAPSAYALDVGRKREMNPKLLIQDILVGLGIKKPELYARGEWPVDVNISKLRLRRHEDGCGATGRIRVSSKVRRIFLEAFFYNTEKEEIHREELDFLVDNETSALFSIPCSSFEVEEAYVEYSKNN